ncbi:MAG: hypothetical protein HRU28_15405, partial [Rhizobiales bacterium]|nr:hypothetical protein [Hyphomicrobiales bacterium]
MTEKLNALVATAINAKQETIDNLSIAKLEAIEIIIIALKKHMEAQNTFTYLDIADLIVEALTLLGVFWAAWAYMKQANASVDQAKSLQTQSMLANSQFEIIEKRNSEKEFEQALMLLDPDKVPTAWYAALRTLENMAINDPDKWFITTLQALIVAGKTFSTKIDNIREEKAKSNSTTDPYFDCDKLTHLETRFIVDLLHAIGKIRSCPNCKDYIKINDSDIQIDGFKVYYGYNKNDSWVFNDSFFQNLTFLHCDFSGIEFRRCNFYGTRFYRVDNINIKECILFPYPLIPPATKKSNYFADSKQFNFDGEKNYIWDTQLDDLNKINNGKFLKENFNIINWKHYNEWIKQHPP